MAGLLLACGGGASGTPGGGTGGAPNPGGQGATSAGGGAGSGGTGGSVCTDARSVGGGPNVPLPQGTPGCNTLGDPPTLTAGWGKDSAPWMGGGLIVDGSYVMTAADVYPQVGYDVTLNGTSLGYRFRFQSGIIDEVVSFGGKVGRGSAVYQVQCGQLTLHGYCGNMENVTYAYDATPDRVRYVVPSTGFDVVVVLAREPDVGTGGAGGAGA